MFGWNVRYLKLGHQNSHIHPDGWLSGVFYLKIPQKIEDNQGSIEFSIHGFNYPIVNKNKETPSSMHKPVPGDLVLFPSSLFHKTIPCNSIEERHVIAFDIRP